MLLFINDLPRLLKYCFSDFFADDATFHTSSSDINDIDTEIQTDFGTSKSWSKRIKMTTHCVKTTYILVGARGRLNDNYQLTLSIDNKPIKKVSKQNAFRRICGREPYMDSTH